MTMKIKSACMALFCSCLATVGAETIDIYETWKDQAFGSTFSKFAAGNTYTLSQDFSITNSSGARQKVWLPKGELTTFDFSDGNHVLKTGTIQLYNSNSKPCEVSFIGGTWDVGGNPFMHCGWDTLPGENLTYRFNGVVVTNLSNTTQLMLGYGTNQNFLVTGGSRFYGTSGYIDLCAANTNENHELGRLIEFSGGSKFYPGSGTGVYDNRGKSSTRLQNCTIRFKGEGTVATGSEAGGAGNSDFYLGRHAPGYRLEVVDGARFNFRFFKMGGDYNNGTPGEGSEFGYSNSVYVANGGEISATYSISIGQVQGAGHNSFLLDDGGVLDLPSGQSIAVGSRSSFNSFTVTNGTVTAQTIFVGYNAGASNNVVRLVGDRANVSLSASPYIPFRLGTGNSLILDGGFCMGNASRDMKFTDGVASTGNLVRVDGGSVLTARYIRVAGATNSVDNTFYIGSDATVVADEISMNGAYTTGNTLCISNGTLRYTGGYGLYCGGSGNVCRIAGAAPKVRYVGESSGVATFRYGVELQYDLTGVSAAYAEPAMLVKKFEMYSGTHLTFRGVEDAAKRIPTRTDFVLVRVTDDNHLVLSNVDAGVITEAEASLPDCAKLLVANDGHDLVLRVRSTMPGFSIFVR